MPRARAFSRTPEASSAEYIRKRLPQPMAKIDTDAPVRPRVRWGMVVAAAAVGAVRTPGNAAAAAPAMALFSRNSRRENLSSWVLLTPVFLSHAGELRRR